MVSFHGLTEHICIFTKEISTKIKNSHKTVAYLFDKGLLIEPFG
jgi:hypothetical protein